MTSQTQTVISEAFINASEGYRFGDGEQAIGETIFADVEPSKLAGELYRFGLREYGRCTGKVYVDSTDGVRHVGYVFERIERYEDTGEPYKREVWLSIERRTVTPTVYEGVAL